MEGDRAIKEYFQSIIERQVYTHAYLFVGPQSSGRSELVTGVIQGIYCQPSPQDGLFSSPKDSIATRPCLSCVHCKQVQDQIHPDIKYFSPEEGKHAISIKQIRELQSHIQQSPSVSTHTIAIIYQAHLLSLAASNALLKTLEEPSQSSIIFLVTHSPDELLATIRSRSQIIELSPTFNEDSLSDEQSLFLSLMNQSVGSIFTQLDSLFKKNSKHSDEKQVWYKRLEEWKRSLRYIYMLKLGLETGHQYSSDLTLVQLQKAIDELSLIQKRLSQNVNLRLQIETFFVSLRT